MKLITTRVARYNCTAPARTKALGSPAKGPRPRLAKYDARSADAAANDAHQRGGSRNAATRTSASSMKGRSKMVVTLPGGAENTQIVMPSNVHPMIATSTAGEDGAASSGLRHLTAQAMMTGATHTDPNQLPAHHSCHSRR